MLVSQTAVSLRHGRSICVGGGVSREGAAVLQCIAQVDPVHGNHASAASMYGVQPNEWYPTLLHLQVCMIIHEDAVPCLHW